MPVRSGPADNQYGAGPPPSLSWGSDHDHPESDCRRNRQHEGCVAPHPRPVEPVPGGLPHGAADVRVHRVFPLLPRVPRPHRRIHRLGWVQRAGMDWARQLPAGVRRLRARDRGQEQLDLGRDRNLPDGDPGVRGGGAHLPRHGRPFPLPVPHPLRDPNHHPVDCVDPALALFLRERRPGQCHPREPGARWADAPLDRGSEYRLVLAGLHGVPMGQRLQQC